MSNKERNNFASNNKTTKKIKQGKIDVDFEQSSLVVNFEVELVCT